MADNQQELVEFEFPDEKQEAQTPEPEAVEAKSEVQIEIEDDTPPEDRDRKPIPKAVVKELDEKLDDELEQYSQEAKEKLRALKKVWHDERRQKEAAYREQQEAIRLAQKLIEENKSLKQKLSSGEEVYVDAVKQAVERDLEIAKSEYKAAYEAGDSEKMLEAQEKLTAARIKYDKVENYRPVYKNALQEQENEVQIAQQAIPKPDERALAWQKRNEWFGQDEEMTSLALGLHEKLIKSGVPVGSDEYYERIDQRMRKLFPEQFEDNDDEEVPNEPAKVKKASPTVVAPASRSTSPKKIRLSKTQVMLAKKLGLTPEQYARELTKLEAQNG